MSMLGSLKIKSMFSSLFNIDREERIKFFFLTASFFFIIASYTLVKELKDSIFMTVVGRDFLPWVKIIAIVAMIPSVMFYSYLVDKMRRYQLLRFYSLGYGIIGLFFAYMVGHPTIGIQNAVADPTRLFGWLFYFFIEGYSPFIVGVFWAFANSITSPDGAKKSYGLMVSGSKLGGAMSAGLAWFLFSCTTPGIGSLSGVAKHQILITVSAILLLMVPIIMGLLVKYVPGKSLHGYEAAYQLEKKQARKGGAPKVGMLSGFKTLLQTPYVMGIFGFVFFYEASYVVINFQRLILVQNVTNGISGLSCELFRQIFMVHMLGCLFSLVGTSALMRKIGERRCLLLIPIVSGMLIAYFLFATTLSAVVGVFVGLRALHYALSYPVRESLYIPTVKDIKFKSKSWIDAFGTKIAKGFGNSFNIIARRILASFGSAAFVGVNSVFLALMVGFWTLVAYLVGKRFQKAVDNNEVIGANDVVKMQNSN